jgi:beta-lactamase class D
MIRRALILITLLSLMSLISCNSGDITVHPGWEKYFSEEGVKGCMMVHDYNMHRFDVYNQGDMERRLLPASTFKILNSLIGLETGIVSDTSMVIRWDSVIRPVNAWNQDLTMGQAFRYSSVPYFQEVARRIGRDTMQFYLDTVKYGNMTIGARIDSFWLDNSLKISPDEELGFVEKLYFSQLPFKEISKRLVIALMHMESYPNYNLYYKTGWGTVGGSQIAWIVGWELENEHPHFFVLNFSSDTKNVNIPLARMRILRKVLSACGLMQGRK